jgi:GTP-sensing pleiotropic transcriptional regulator CodY
VKSAALNQFDRAGVTAQDSLRRQFDTENYQDYERSLAMATDAVAGEKRMGTEILSRFNASQAQDARNLQQYGSFGSNLMGGLAEGGMSVAYSNQYAQLMSKGA